MYHTGIADEAGADLATQIRAHKDLGWEYVELRNIDGKQFTDVSDKEFDAARAALDEAGMKVSCFASGIANWACRISDPLENSVETLRLSIPRMQALGTKYIRAMSWPNDGLGEEEWRDEVVRRFAELAVISEDGGIVIVVENCDGWAGASAANYRRFFEMVDSPAVRAVYDTGNPPMQGHTNTWEWYSGAKPYIEYVHIKSHTGPLPDGEDGHYTWPGEGGSMELQALTDLFESGYDGGISIEPHLETVIHEGKDITDAEAAYQTYTEYGRRTMEIVRQALAAAGR